MCQVQSTYFLVDSVAPQPPCLTHSFNLTGSIQFEVDVAFFSNETAQQVYGYIGIRFPDGSSRAFYTNGGNPVSIGSPGTYNFIASNFVDVNMPGTYTFLSFDVFNYAKSATLCNVLAPTGTYGCSQINLQPTPATVNIQTIQGRGSLVASRNGTVVRTINPGDGLVPVSYNIGDNFYFQAYPDTTLGYSFDKFCGDTACAVVSTTNPFGGTITAVSGFLYVYFKGGPPPTITPPPPTITPPPPGTGWSCVNNKCVSGCTTPTSVGPCYTLQSACTAKCICKSSADCPADSVCLSSIGLGCQSKMLVVGVVAFFALMMMKQA